MINELIIHLGDTKTGSTSIQKALVRNICQAPGKTIIYPTKNNHIGLAKTLDQKRRFNERAGRFNRLNSAFQESDADYGIVSAEHFQFVDPQTVHHAIETYWPDLTDRLRLVAYVRPHGDKMLSAFSEHVKLGSKLQSVETIFEKMSKLGWLDYTKRFEKWRDIFGDRFELRPFVREQLYQGDVVSDFFRFVLKTDDFELTGAVSANASLTISQLSLLREMHKHLSKKLRSPRGPKFREAESSAGRVVAEYIQANGLGKESDKLRMPSSLVDRFTEKFAADAEALDAAFFDGSPMSDALEKIHLKATDAVQSLDAGDHFSPDVISTVHVFADVLADLLGTNPDQFKQAIVNSRSKAEADA